MADLILFCAIPTTAPILSLPRTAIERIEALAEAAFARAGKPIVDRAAFDAANQLYSDLAQARKLIEDRRTEAKRPVIDLGKAIDEACKPYAAMCSDAEVMLAPLLKAYERAEQERVAREKAEAERVAREERERLEAAERARVDAAIDDSFPGDEPVMVEHKVHVPVAYVPPAPKSAVRSKASKVLVIEDRAVIPRSVRVGDEDVALWILDEVTVKRLLTLKTKIAGVRLDEVEGFAPKGARQ